MGKVEEEERVRKEGGEKVEGNSERERVQEGRWQKEGEGYEEKARKEGGGKSRREW